MVGLIRITVLGLVLLTAFGCASRSRSFAGYDSDNVWTALVAVAQSPDYDDADPAKRWAVEENEVWVDEPGQRIEVYRQLTRRIYRPGKVVRREDQSWKFRVTLDREDPEDPKATFVSRGFAWPTQAVAEGDKYFEDVLVILGGPSTATASSERGSRAAVVPVPPSPPSLVVPAPGPQPEERELRDPAGARAGTHGDRDPRRARSDSVDARRGRRWRRYALARISHQHRREDG